MAEPGIQREYLDNADRPARLDDRTVAALQAAIGEPDADESLLPLAVRTGARLTGHGPVLAVRLEDGREVEADATAALELPPGYHWLETPAGPRRLIVSPGACVLPPARAWGWTAQLYASRSQSSWGIGDLADLGSLTRLARDQGAGFVLVNPLHAGGSTSVTEPQQPSPYFPSSRRFLNPIYLAVNDIPGAKAAAGERLDGLAAAGLALLASRQIDRDAVWRLKRPALRAIFDALPPEGEFTDWRRAHGEAIEEFATWSVLSERYGGSWRDWPAGARRPDGELARALRTEAADELTFVAWLQWQTERQLRAAGANLPILQDLPIGVDPNGADAWAYQDVLADGVTVGAPPDPFNRAGQDWGLPPFVPWRLRAANYQPFIEAIRATIALSGGLRIDHVMGLFRLWWVPAGLGAGQGGYVRYPASDLLDIVALESQRVGAPVVGEDLGTVEPGVREELAARNVLSYRLLWFEADAPAVWPTSAMAAVETHDLPTVAGVWTGSDLVDQAAAGVDADAESTARIRRLLIDEAGVTATATPAEAVLGAYRLLARAPSLLLAATLDDAVAEPSRPNMPGTTERANWSLALDVAINDFADHDGMNALAAVLAEAVGAPPQPAP